MSTIYVNTINPQSGSTVTVGGTLVISSPVSGALAGPGSYVGLDSSNQLIITSSAGGGGGTPGGSNTQIQYNNAGAFAGDANLTYDGSGLIITGSVYQSSSFGTLTVGVDPLNPNTGSFIYQNDGNGFFTASVGTAFLGMSRSPVGPDEVVLSGDVVSLNGSYTMLGGTTAVLGDLELSDPSTRSGSIAGPGSYLGVDTAGVVVLTSSAGGGGGGTPGGSNTQIQYNNGGAFGGSANLTLGPGTLNFTGSQIISGSTSVHGSTVFGSAEFHNHQFIGSADFSGSVFANEALRTDYLYASGSNGLSIDSRLLITGSVLYHTSAFGTLTVGVDPLNPNTGSFIYQNDGNGFFTASVGGASLNMSSTPGTGAEVVLSGDVVSLNGSYTMLGGTTAVLGDLELSDPSTRSGSIAGPGSYLGVDTAGVVVLTSSAGGGGGGTPGGSNTQIQYNNGGAFGGSANLTYDGLDLYIGATASVNNLFVVTSSFSPANSPNLRVDDNYAILSSPQVTITDGANSQLFFDSVGTTPVQLTDGTSTLRFSGSTSAVSIERAGLAPGLTTRIEVGGTGAGTGGQPGIIALTDTSGTLLVGGIEIIPGWVQPVPGTISFTGHGFGFGTQSGSIQYADDPYTTQAGLELRGGSGSIIISTGGNPLNPSLAPVPNSISIQTEAPWVGAGFGPPPECVMTFVTGAAIVHGGPPYAAPREPKINFEVHYTGSRNPINLPSGSVGNGGGEVVYFGDGGPSCIPGHLHYLDASGSWNRTNARGTGSLGTGSAGNASLLGIPLGVDPLTDGVLIRGFYNLAPAAAFPPAPAAFRGPWITGSTVYVNSGSADGDAGYITATAPTATDSYVRSVGYCTTQPDIIYFNPDSSWTVNP